jgi:murein DD-endopeptidase MepM/ murein hydrolase activator NlpD
LTFAAQASILAHRSGLGRSFAGPRRALGRRRRHLGDDGLDDGAQRASPAKREAGTPDLGHEPPLSADGSEATVIDRRRVSVQWFSGTILTGLCGAALIGGAVFGALDGETTFAKTPERIGTVGLRSGLGAFDRNPAAHKTDRLPPPSEHTGSRQVVRVSQAMRVGNRDIMRVRPFVRVSGNLSLTSGDVGTKVPPFNAQRLLTESAPASNDDENAAEVAESDAEVSFVMRDLAAVLPRARIVAHVPIEDVLGRVRDASNWRNMARQPGVRYASAGRPGLKMAYAAESPIDPYAGFETRIVPENVTLLAKTKAQVTGGYDAAERTHLVRKGDTLVSVLRDLGATAEDAATIVATLGLRGRDGALKEGQKLRILIGAGPGQAQRPVRIIVAGDAGIEVAAALSDLGRYVAIDPQSMNRVTETAAGDDDDDGPDDGTGIRLYQSIYETALRDKVPVPVIEDMIRIYSYDVDFQRRVQAGDSFEVFFAGDDETTPGAERNDVLYASLTVAGETKKYYRFQTPDDSIVDYYDETGKSAKKFLVRKPVNNAIMRSGFGGRRHPILGFTKMHTGVDWSAPYGTPIFASGNGVIETAGWEGGYGKYVKIRHPNGYETAYGHMSAFAKGMEPGKRVRQGQVIGFVGSTGLSTGAHVHYEILVNGRFVDPMRIKLPRGRSLDGPLLASFEHERGRLDKLVRMPAAPRGPEAQLTQTAPRGAGLISQANAGR